MKNSIEERLAKAIDQIPIGLLESLKNQPTEKMIAHDYITRQENFRTKRIWSYPGLALAALLIGFFFLKLLPSHTIAGSLYIDLNPSIEINYNTKEEVLSINALKSEDKVLIQDIIFKGRDIYRVTEDVIEVLPKKGNSGQLQPALLVSVENKDQEKAQLQTEKLEEVIKGQLRRENIKQVVLSQNIISSHTLEDFSQKYRVSIGKMIFIRNLIILNPSLKTEDLASLTIDALVRLSLETGLNLNKIVHVEEDIQSLYKEEITHDTSPPKNGERDKDKKPSKKLLTEKEVRDIVLNLVKGKIKEIDIDLEREDGDLIYEIEIETKDREYDIIIDAYTGKILEFEVEDD